MNDTQPDLQWSAIAAVIRQLLTFIGGLLVTKGIITDGQAPELIGAGMAVASLIWSLIQKRNARLALKAAIAAPAGLAK